MTTCSDVVGYQHFRGPRYLHLQHYTASQPRRSRLESSSPWSWLIYCNSVSV